MIQNINFYDSLKTMYVVHILDIVLLQSTLKDAKFVKYYPISYKIQEKVSIFMEQRKFDGVVEWGLTVVNFDEMGRTSNPICIPETSKPRFTKLLVKIPSFFGDSI